jgi:hypothetical protein
MSYDRKNRVLYTSRVFTSKIVDVAPEHYSTLKTWYDRVARADQHEVVFSRKVPPAATPAATGAAQP